MREGMLRQMRNTRFEGEKISFMGEEYVVFPDVFRPFYDTELMVECMQINAGERVRDLGTGSGVLAIQAMKKGACHVIATDINPNAVKAATINAYLHGLSYAIDTRREEGICHKTDEYPGVYDVILANLPFTNFKVRLDGKNLDLAERAVYYRQSPYVNLINNAHLSLRNPGRSRIYLAQANLGDAAEVLELAHSKGYNVELLGEKRPHRKDPRKFYCFEVKKEK